MATVTGRDDQVFFFHTQKGLPGVEWCRGLGDVYIRQVCVCECVCVCVWVGAGACVCVCVGVCVAVCVGVCGGVGVE